MLRRAAKSVQLIIKARQTHEVEMPAMNKCHDVVTGARIYRAPEVDATVNREDRGRSPLVYRERRKHNSPYPGHKLIEKSSARAFFARLVCSSKMWLRAGVESGGKCSTEIKVARCFLRALAK